MPIEPEAYISSLNIAKGHTERAREEIEWASKSRSRTLQRSGVDLTSQTSQIRAECSSQEGISTFLLVIQWE
jgi:hypothetical protein